MKKSRIDIIFEKIPPAITWIIILFPFWGGFFYPQITAYIVIIFNVFFLYKSISFAIFFAIAVQLLRKSEAINWLNRLMELHNIEQSINDLKQKLLQLKKFEYDASKSTLFTSRLLRIFKRFEFIKKFIFSREQKKAQDFIHGEIARLEEIKDAVKNKEWKDLHHVIIIPHWKEPMSVLRDTLENIKNSNYPGSKINIVLGAEARDEEGLKKSLQLKHDYQEHFENFWVNNHVMQDNEIVGKSSNMASAGKMVTEEIRKLGWDFKKVIITSCDADSLLPKDYFANVSYKYITTPESEYKYYHAAVMFYANIWRLPFYARINNSLFTIGNLAKLPRTDKLVPFSTYSVSLWLISEIGYWTPWVTPEDFHLFFKGLFYAPDKVETIPIYQRIMSDAAEGDNHIDTIKNNYFQQRRWSWGISDDGWALKQLIKLARQGKITLHSIYMVFHVIFDHVMGMGLTTVVVIGGNIPPLINSAFAHTVLGANLPGISSLIINITLWILLMIIIIDTLVLKPNVTTRKKISALFEWIALPYASMLLVILPGIDAHTRLLFGRYLEYYLTKKK